MYQDYSNRGGGFFANMPMGVKNLIIINAVMLLLSTLKQDLMLENFALFYPTSPFFKPWQIVTHLFMHGGFWHLLFNMYALWMFGSILENIWGTKKFLLYYFVTGLGAAFLHMGVQWIEVSNVMKTIEENAAGAAAAVAKYRLIMGTPTVGASGAIYGILLAFGLLFPNNELRFVFTPISFKAKYWVIGFAALELILGVVGKGNIAHFAHLGGMLFGFLLILYWKKRHKLYNR